jgi:uncharacterized damage-inducible protein DinB
MFRFKLIASTLLFLVVVSLAVAQQSPQTPPTNLAEAFDRQIMNVEKTVVDAADAMPADKYDFAPSEKLGDFKGVRTFAEQVRHIATANYLFGSALLGEKPPFPADPNNVNGPDTNKTKEQIMKYLRDSYAVAHRAMTKINDANKLEMVQSPFGNKITRFGMSNILVWHPYDHYGQMVVYLRLNGIVPPASRQN